MDARGSAYIPALCKDTFLLVTPCCFPRRASTHGPRTASATCLRIRARNRSLNPLMNHGITSVSGYARTARHRVTRNLEQTCLPSKCYVCLKRLIHRPDFKAPHEWHHKNGNPFDNQKRNLVPLCSGCHSEVHVFAIQTYLVASWNRLGMRISND